VTARTIEFAPSIHRAVSGAAAAASLTLLGLEDATSPVADVSVRALADWVRTYLMRPHADLGRSGHVCPFTAQSTRLALLRIGSSPLGGDDRAGILRTMQDALRAFDTMPCKRSARIFRTVIVAFPHCADAAGLAALRHVQNAMRHHSIIRAKMIGLFEPDSQAEGLINPAFRPLRSPVPALAIRMLVEQDAPFVVRNPLLVPVYAAKFPVAGLKLLVRGDVLSRLIHRLAAGIRRPREPSRHGS
jgi:hypothetical protein